MKVIHENRLIRKLFNDVTRIQPSYYNDKQTRTRRRIFKSNRVSPRDCEQIVKQLEYFGIEGWNVWHDSGYQRQTGIYKRTPLD